MKLFNVVESDSFEWGLLTMA